MLRSPRRGRAAMAERIHAKRTDYRDIGEGYNVLDPAPNHYYDFRDNMVFYWVVDYYKSIT